ncbi:MAG: hypothetical protein KA207_13105 [Burkholderiaceae bacterium]|nr:hypothetical protein [Burkholderiaceae bacterium]
MQRYRASALRGHHRARCVLERCHRGLIGEGAVVNEAEAQWVIRRLAELLEW